MRDVENPKPSHNRNIPIEKLNKDKLDGTKKDNIYNSLYEGQEIHQPFYTKTYSEVPSSRVILIAMGLYLQKRSKVIKSFQKSYLLLTPVNGQMALKVLTSAHVSSTPSPRNIVLLNIDTGAVVTVVAPGPNDIVRPNLALKAANGSLIECYGYKKSA